MSEPRTSEEIGGAATAPALEVTDLCVDYRVRGVWREVLRGISFTVERGTSYGLVGESGCGKSTTALAAIRYLPRNGRVRSGSIEVAGVDVLGLRGRDLQRYRGDVVSMVYQNPGTALNPVDPRRQAARRGVHDPRDRAAQTRTSARWRCCGRCRSPTRSRSCSATRTSSRAACSSAS